MALSSMLGERTSPLVIAFGCFVVLASLFLYLFQQPSFPKNAPRRTPESWPIFGSWDFFTQRWDFYRRSMAHNKGGHFSFYAGSHPVVALAGDEGRRVFFESKGLNFGAGYAALLGGSPQVKEDNNPLAADVVSEGGFSAYFNKRIIAMMKGNQLAKGLPNLIKDSRSMLDELAAKGDSITDPFDSIYRMVFQLTMRTVACNEIANDPALLAKTLSYYEEIENTGTALSIMFPWLPTPAKLRRLYSGSQLYMIFKKVIDDRKKEQRREDDALQYLLDQGDSLTDIIQFVLGALFAGQLNSGINAAWILLYLANKPYWMERVRDEIDSVADRYAPNKDTPLKERLMQLPIEAWEGEFPIIDICLKDSIRLQMPGTAFRKNTSGVDIPLNKAGTEVIPSGAYATYAVSEAHANPEIFENPEEWDPSRYLPERAEDKKRQYGWFGWGVARHPCLGMRFAKLEINIIVAFFLAYFDELQPADKDGNPREKLPPTDLNRHTAHKPEEHVYLKYKVRT